MNIQNRASSRQQMLTSRKESGKRESRREAGPSKFSFIQLTSYNTRDHLVKMKGKEKLMENFDSAVEKC